MKLRNKKTGEIFDALIREKGGGGSYSLIVCDIKAYETSKSTLDETHFILDEYETLAELNAEWEDYKPKEPLIKDEKIRKAVRAWSEVNSIKKALYSVRTDGRLCVLTDMGNYDFSIEFVGWIPTLKDGESYTIAELCGEEEE